jgi:hypothetical protein
MCNPQRCGVAAHLLQLRDFLPIPVEQRRLQPANAAAQTETKGGPDSLLKNQASSLNDFDDGHDPVPALYAHPRTGLLMKPNHTSPRMKIN